MTGQTASDHLAGLTASLAGLTGFSLTELKLCRKRMIQQTINAIANCNIIQ